MSEDTMELRLLMPESARVSQTTISTGIDIAQYRSDAGRAGDSEDSAADGNHSDVSGYASRIEAARGIAFSEQAGHGANLTREALHPALSGGKEGLSEPKLHNENVRSPKYRRIIRLWYLELLACTLSFACFGAIAWVLAYEDGKPLARWDFLMSPTAFVSFIGVLGKSSFLLVVTEVISQLKWLHYRSARHCLKDFEAFDSASRGPLGASRLLWTRRWNSWLATTGALIVLVSLTVSPFVQLVFNFPIRTTTSGLEHASFRRARIYNPSHRKHENVTLSSGALDLPMQWAILRSVYDSPSEQSVTCSSGNCTISNVQTLAVCSSCNNLDDKIAIECDEREQHLTSVNRSVSCRYAFPSRDGVRPEWVLEAFAQTRLDTNGNFMSSYTRWNSSTTEKAPGDHIRRLLAVQMENSSDVLGTLEKPTAWACEISLCEQTFESIDIVNGKMVVSPPVEKALFLGDTTFNGLEDTQPQAGESFHQFLLAGNTEPSYWINVMDYSSMGMYLTDLLVLAYWSDGVFASERAKYSIQAWGHIAPDVGRILANAKDIPKLFDMIARNMTEEIRMQGVMDLNDTLGWHHGVANRTETYIEVRWGYLAFPFTLTAMSTAMLAVAIVLTERSNVPAWRSSSLAVLFHGLHGWNMDGQIATNPGELEAKANHMRATLSADEWPPSFVKAD